VLGAGKRSLEQDVAGDQEENGEAAGKVRPAGVVGHLLARAGAGEKPSCSASSRRLTNMFNTVAGLEDLALFDGTTQSVVR